MNSLARRRTRALLLALLLVLLPMAALGAWVALQNPSVPWHHIGGGSAVLQGGGYTLISAVGAAGGGDGQPSGGGYALVGAWTPPNGVPPVIPEGPSIYLPIVAGPQQ